MAHAVPPAPFDLTIERLTYGFDAIGHRDGEVVFVPYAAPGDHIVAMAVARRSGVLRARIERVVTPGPARVEPRCPYFGRCGGCQWQHVSPDAQRAAKTALVREQLARVAGLADVTVLPIVAAGDDWRYRARITLAVDGRRLGFRGARSHALVPIDDCLIADAAVAAHLTTAQRWVASLRTVPERVTIARTADGVVLAGVARNRPGAADQAAAERILAEVAAVRGVVLTGRDGRVTAGDPRLHVPVEPGLDLEVPADVFTQVNPTANRALVAMVTALADVAPGERALDLFCGAGNFALPLARRGAVVHGIERSALAVDTARANATRLRLDATFEAGDVAARLARAGDALDLVVLDPPRTGAADVMEPLARRRPARIVYVSCDPATLARDVRILVDAGYRLDRVHPIDVFPQTYHIETAALLKLT